MQPAITSADALTQLQSAQGSAQDPNSYLTSQNQALGVNDAQNTVTGLRGAINNTTKLLQQVAPSIMGRTAGSLVNAAQAQRQIANEQAPINDTLTQEGNQYNEANTNLSQLQDRASQTAADQYQGQQDKLSYLQNVYNSLYQKESDATKLAEQAREADLSAKSSGGGYDLSSLLGGSSTSAAQPRQVEAKPGSFAFYDANNAPITAYQYANQSGQAIGDVLHNMALEGDKTAESIYNTLKPYALDGEDSLARAIAQLRQRGVSPELLGGS